MSPLPTNVVNEFVQLCNWTFEVWRTHRLLFDDNPRAAELQQSVAGDALGRLSIVTQEYLIQQISKLHDPSLQFGQANLGINYILQEGSWDSATLARLNSLKTNLDGLAILLKPARNKLLSHSDLKTITTPNASLGSFPANADIDYFAALQEFVDIVYGKTVGGPFPFNPLADNDAVALLATIKP